MCILAIKPKGVAPISQERLKIMYEYNPDGAGIAFARKGKIYVIKGLMTLAEFLLAAEKIKPSDTALYHARISTGGGVCAELTHPYLICDDYKSMKKLKYETTGNIFAHNGIFSEFNAKSGVNDSMQFCLNYLKPLDTLKRASGGSLLDDDLRPVLSKLCGYASRIALLDARGNYAIYGSGWEYDEGVFFSNETYKKRKSYYYQYGNFWKQTKYPTSATTSTPPKEAPKAQEAPKESAQNADVIVIEKDHKNAGEQAKTPSTDKPEYKKPKTPKEYDYTRDVREIVKDTTLDDIAELKENDRYFAQLLKDNEFCMTEREIYAYYMLGYL